MYILKEFGNVYFWKYTGNIRKINLSSSNNILTLI